jgi:putative phage-type endonuclease
MALDRSREVNALATEFVQNTPAWVDARRNFIGSSDVPVLTGNSPYATSALELWAYKTRRPDGTFLLDPEPPDAETQELFDLGHALEPVIADRCAIQHGALRRKPRMLVHADIPWAAASLDRHRAGTDVEVKWVPNRSWRGGAEAVPSYVQDQVQWQMFVTGIKRGHVAVLHGSHIECHDLDADRDYQDALLTIATDFHDNFVVPGVMPPIDGSEATRRTLTRMYPRDTLGYAEPSAEIEALVRAIREAGAIAREAGDDEARAKNALRAVLEEHAGVEGDGYRVTFTKNRDSTTVKWELVASAYRQLLLDAFGPGGRSEADALMELGLPFDMAVPEAVAAIHSIYTQPREGARPLVVKVRDDETGKWV